MRKEKIAIYGIGVETPKALVTLSKKYKIIGLLDGFRTDGKIYGYSITSIDKAIEEKITRIIVVARPGSCKAITKRIGLLCKKHKIKLYDIRGNDLLSEKKVEYNFKSIKGYTKNEIISQINNAEVISFDLFDTLIVRNVLSYSDLIELVDARLKEIGIFISDFVSKRIGIEKSLSIEKSPTLEVIYQKLLQSEKKYIDAFELSNLEYDIDYELIQPRNSVIELIKYSKKIGKRVFITSDSYYTKEQIKAILINNDITEINDILVSCEYNTGKNGELFNKLIEIAKTDNILHVGDDYVADIESAQRHGLKSFHIFSSLELFDLLGGLNLYKNENNLSDRIKIGMLIARIFNNPFQFEDEKKRITMDNSFDIGYSFIAPMVMDFTKWFGEKIKNKNIKNVWFGARDGYLIQKIYNLIYPDEKTEYFFTSRVSAIRSGMSSRSDIEYVDNMKFSGELADNLKVRFGINIADIPPDSINENESGLLKYSTSILEKSLEHKRNYLKYIESLELQNNEVAFFDFVAKGTCQMFIQKLIPNKVIGLYFLQLEPQFMKDKCMNIIPFYTESERETSVIFENYYILETILTSPEPSVERFDENGKVIYAKETREKRNIDCLLRIHDGIISYIKKYLLICPKSEFKINKNLSEAILSLIHNVCIKDEEFIDLKIEDPFFNRTTDIPDIL